MKSLVFLAQLLLAVDNGQTFNAFDNPGHIEGNQTIREQFFDHKEAGIFNYFEAAKLATAEVPTPVVLAVIAVQAKTVLSNYEKHGTWRPALTYTWSF